MIDHFERNETTKITSYRPNISKSTKCLLLNLKGKFNHKTYKVNSFERQQRYVDESLVQLKVRYRKREDDTLCLSENDREDDRRCQDRYGFPLDPNMQSSTATDTFYHGSAFITEWILSFTHGRLKVTFNQIFSALIEGIQKEGEQEKELHLKDIIDNLYTIKNDNTKMQDRKRMKKLEEECARLYTKTAFLFGLVNRTLREHNREKLFSMGPYCYLLYNYIGSDMVELTSIRHRFRALTEPKMSRPMIVYRGDVATQEKIEEYRQAAGKKDKYFKWLPFVSTSRDEQVARQFSKNILYEIELCLDTTSDQFIDIGDISFHQEEKEVLLRPGGRFRVDRVQFDEKLGHERVYIKILPTYVSYLT